MIIRDEIPADVDAITDVTVAAFRALVISSKTEQFIVKALRSAGVLTISLVAEIDNRVVGHAAFSPVAISDGSPNWYGLGPISVLPEYQRKGIGKALVETGLTRLQKLQAQGCCLVGDPGYYQRFGFRNIPGLIYEGIPQEYVLALRLGGNIPQGTVSFHEAFQASH
jgi:putative acetyltransferase